MDDLLGAAAASIGIERSCEQRAAPAPAASHSSDSINTSSPAVVSPTESSFSHALLISNQGQLSDNDREIKHLLGFKTTYKTSGSGRRAFVRNDGSSLLFWSARIMSVEQRAPPIFGRAAITLGTGPLEGHHIIK